MCGCDVSTLASLRSPACVDCLVHAEQAGCLPRASEAHRGFQSESMAFYTQWYSSQGQDGHSLLRKSWLLRLHCRDWPQWPASCAAAAVGEPSRLAFLPRTGPPRPVHSLKRFRAALRPGDAGEMAPRNTTGRPTTKQPVKRSPKVLWLCYIGIPVALVFFLLGLGGVAVLLGAPPTFCIPCTGHIQIFPAHLL